MMRFTRFGLAAAFAITLATSNVRAAEPDKLLPADADTVFYVNVKQVVESEVVKKYALEQIKQALAGEDAKKLLEEMGLDPLKDIETLWAGTSGKDRDDMKGLIIIHGKFEPEKLFKAAEIQTKKEGDKFSMVKDGTATLFKYQPDQGNPIYGTVFDEKTVLAGTDKKIVADALKQAEEKKPMPLGKELTAALKKMDEKSSIFVVSVVKGKFKNVKLPAEIPFDLSGLEKALPFTNTMSLVVRLSADIGLEVAFGMQDEDSAADMGDAVAELIKGVQGLAPLAAAADPRFKPLPDVVKTLKSDVKNQAVTLTGKLTGDNLGKMINPGD